MRLTPAYTLPRSGASQAHREETPTHCRYPRARASAKVSAEEGASNLGRCAPATAPPLRSRAARRTGAQPLAEGTRSLCLVTLLRDLPHFPLADISGAPLGDGRRGRRGR